MLNGKKVIALIQARCTSTRLPMKHFRYIGDKRLIDWVVDRLRNIDEIDEIIISTTNDETDGPFKQYCKTKGIGFYGYDGDINDVVGRHYNAVIDNKADYIVVISGDCPLIDERVVEKQLELLAMGYDYCRPRKRCIHEGIDCYSNNCLELINSNSKTAYQRENFGIIIRENLDLVNVGYFDLAEKYTKNKFRISVDNMADLRFMVKIFNDVEKIGGKFYIDEVIDLVNANNELLKINSHVQQKRKGEKTYRFLIKTEASQEKGLGHLRRMMVLGQYLNEDKNNGVLYAINDDKEAKDILDSNGYYYDYTIAQKEQEVISELKKYKADILIIDVQKYEDETQYNFENIKKKTGIKKIVLIDKYVEDKNVDLMVIQGIQSEEFEEKVKGNDKILYGLDCVFINNQFKVGKLKKEKLKKNSYEKEIVISFGSSDTHNLTIKVLDEINNTNIDIDVKFKIILGPYYNEIDKLNKKLSRFRYNFEVIKNPLNFTNELIACDYGIIAYGVTFYEFLYMGIPTVNYTINYNDSYIVKKMKKMGIAFTLDQILSCRNELLNFKNRNIKINDLENIYFSMTKES